MLAAVVVPLVGKAHGDPVPGEGPELLDETVVELSVPLAREKVNDRETPLKELAPVAPAAVLAVGEGHSVPITAVPGVLRETDLPRCGFCGESYCENTRQRRRRALGFVRAATATSASWLRSGCCRVRARYSAIHTWRTSWS